MWLIVLPKDLSFYMLFCVGMWLVSLLRESAVEVLSMRRVTVIIQLLFVNNNLFRLMWLVTFRHICVPLSDHSTTSRWMYVLLCICIVSQRDGSVWFWYMSCSGDVGTCNRLYQIRSFGRKTNSSLNSRKNSPKPVLAEGRGVTEICIINVFKPCDLCMYRQV